MPRLAARWGTRPTTTQFPAVAATNTRCWPRGCCKSSLPVRLASPSDPTTEDGYGSTALVSQTKMLEAAGTNIFNYMFVETYGMNTDQLVPFNSFLAGDLDAKGLTSALQRISDKVREDDSVDKVKVS